MSILEASICQLAREISGSTSVFHYDAIDCDNEVITLQKAISEGRLNQAEVSTFLAELNAHPVSQDNWEVASDSEIITYLLMRFHRVHRVQLSQLINLSQRVETLNVEHPLCPHGLTLYLTDLKQTLELHMLKEENILFPMLESGQGHLALGPINVMRAEHEAHTQAINQLNQLTHEFNLPNGPDFHHEMSTSKNVQDLTLTQDDDTHFYQDWRSLYLGIAIFKEDLQQHIHLENNILFARYSDPLEDCHASVL